MDTTVYLQQHGIKPSYQRIRILDYLLTKKNHPTADMIYAELAQDIPTLSRTTVYNTMNLFLQNCIVQKIGIDEYEIRYDADISCHAHFKCDNCGKIFDLPVEDNKLKIGGLDKFKVREVQYYIKGLCPMCL